MPYGRFGRKNDVRSLNLGKRCHKIGPEGSDGPFWISFYTYVEYNVIHVQSYSLKLRVNTFNVFRSIIIEFFLCNSDDVLLLFLNLANVLKNLLIALIFDKKTFNFLLTLGFG